MGGGAYQLCVHSKTAMGLLAELHEKVYGSYTGGQSLAYRAITQGFWWPSMQRDSTEYVEKCDQC